ncbi:MAG: hypothetical protein AB7N76_10905 [Planctomycetota bacterium]
MIEALIGNPLSQWGLTHARRDRRFFAVILGFLFLFYGLAMLFVLSWTSSWSRKVSDLLNLFFGETVVVNTLLLLYWAPARVASAIAKQREEGMLDMLRMTGMSGHELAIGHLITQLSLPLLLSACTVPLIVFGLGNEAGPTIVIRIYVCLALLVPVFAMMGALVGLAIKKAQHAGSTAIFVAMGLFFLSGGSAGQPIPDIKVFAMVGFFGPLVAELERNGTFAIPILGTDIPGDLIQIVFLVLLGRALLAGLARRYTGEPALFFGRHGALTLVIALALVSALTYYPEPWPRSGNWWRPNHLPQAEGLAFHLIYPFVALIWFALESSVESRDLIRGLARRDADDFVPDEERLDLRRFIWPALVYMGMGVLFLGSMLVALGRMANRGGGTFEVSTVGLFLGVTVAISAYAAAVLLTQLVTLQLRDRGMPRLLSGVALLVIWIAPVIGSFIMKEMGFPAGLYELPRAINPFYGITMAAATEATNSGGLDPTALGICSAAFHIFAAIGLLNLIRVQQERLLEHASTLVVLPADAYAAPGSLTRKCDKGHLFTNAWAQCPHCEPSADRLDRPNRRAAAEASAQAVGSPAVGAPIGQTQAPAQSPAKAPPQAQTQASVPTGAEAPRQRTPSGRPQTMAEAAAAAARSAAAVRRDDDDLIQPIQGGAAPPPPDKPI